jgi:phosphatidylglycerophosphate synthase
MFVKSFKKATAKIIPPGFFEFLIKIKLTPNRLTVLSAIFGGIAFYFFWHGEIFIGAIFVLLNLLFDGLDGRLARYQGKITDIGGLYDLLTDRGVRLSWLIALSFGGTVSFQLAILIMFLESISYIVTYYIEYKKLKHVNWLPNVVYLLPYGALLNMLDLFFKIELVLGTIVLAIHVISVVIMNPQAGEKFSQVKVKK